MLARTGMLALATVFTSTQASAGKKNNSAAVSLTEEEKNDLLFMREEEKLARDVYLTLFEKWGAPVFANIATSEQQHMDAMLILLNTYKLPDPAAATVVGEFVNTELQDLYNALIQRGNQSVLEALKVGGIIEETDIEDINAAIETSRLAKIDGVYESLLEGSYNHLRAFAKQITSLTGQPYVAQVVSQDIVDAILAG
jgi:hypothetical protein